MTEEELDSLRARSDPILLGSVLFDRVIKSLDDALEEGEGKLHTSAIVTSNDCVLELHMSSQGYKMIDSIFNDEEGRL